MFFCPDEKVNLADAKWEDIHVTTGALKMFFRELPEPLFTYALFNDFVSAISKLETQLRTFVMELKKKTLLLDAVLSPNSSNKKHSTTACLLVVANNTIKYNKK